MSLTAAASGFVILFLTVPVVQGHDDWGVTYISTQICALKGSTVDINCTYGYPSNKNDYDNTVEKFWFTKESNNVYVDLRTDPEYSGRVQYICQNNICTLRITDLRESDSAEYKFRFITNQEGGKYTGLPGVTLSVTDLQVQVNRSEVNESSHCAELKCHSSCRLPGHPSYVWYKNGKKSFEESMYYHYSDCFDPADNYSCAVNGYENSRSPPMLIQSHWEVTYTSTQICAFKGSTVDLRCTYRYPSRISNHHTKVDKTFWFTKKNNDQYVDLKTDYGDRVQYICDDNNCTLRITDLRESDSAEYKFRFTTNQEGGKYTGLPGVTLSVTDPQLQVHVRRSTVNQYSNWTELTCHSECRLPHHPPYAWYKNEQKIMEEKVYFHPHPISPADSYYCAVSGYEAFPSAPVYAPKHPSVSASPSADLMEGSSVNLTCSCDANPAANYTWYKRNEYPDHKRLSEEPQLAFSSIQSSDSGEYYCSAENELGTKTSEYIFIDVKYAPKLPSVSVSPSAEIVEGSSVTLTCSSDANPAANYTWFKKNQTLIQGPEARYYFTSISSKDTGFYNCKSENQYGQMNSLSLFIDVHYAPKLPSVSVSPSAEIVEGSSVTLTCSSDANPAAKYTWYKKNEDSPKASGQIFTITDIRAEHSGYYYCEAQNRRGRHNSTLHLTVVAGALKSAVIGTTPAVFLAIICLSVFLLIRKKRASKQSSKPGERPDNREQCLANQSEEQDDLHYASIHFSKNQTDPVYSNIRPAGPRRHKEEEEEVVVYTAVRFNSASTAPRTTGQEAGEDPAALYSTVNKIAERNRNL